MCGAAMVVGLAMPHLIPSPAHARVFGCGALQVRAKYDGYGQRIGHYAHATDGGVALLPAPVSARECAAPSQLRLWTGFVQRLADRADTVFGCLRSVTRIRAAVWSKAMQHRVRALLAPPRLRASQWHALRRDGRRPSSSTSDEEVVAARPLIMVLGTAKSGKTTLIRCMQVRHIRCCGCARSLLCLVCVHALTPTLRVLSDVSTSVYLPANRRAGDRLRARCFQ